MEMDIDLNGVPDLLRRLKALTGDKQRDAVTRALSAGAHYLEGQFKIAAPVDTGFLRNAIYVRGAQESGYSNARADAEAANPKGEMLAEARTPPEGEVHVIFGAEYTAYVEANQPFITPAFNASKSTVIELIHRHIADFIAGAR